MKASRRLMEHPRLFEHIQDGRISIKRINGPFLVGDKGTPMEYSAGPKVRSRVRRQACAGSLRLAGQE
jgi:hypothetical protein